MLAESILNSRKYASNFQLTEKAPKPIPSSSTKLKSVKDSFNMPPLKPVYRGPHQRELIMRGNSSESGASQDLFSRFTIRPTITIPLNVFEHNKPEPRRPGQRPISVGSKGSRPAFLEPEIQTHFPNKSTLITPNIGREKEDPREAYRFPLYRTKQISGFKLSISPELNESETSFKSMKTPSYGGDYDKSRTQRVPMTAGGKFSVKRTDYHNSEFNQAYGFTYNIKK